MASEPTLRVFAEELWRVLRDYARQHGWADDSYVVYLRINEEWSTAHIVVVSERIEEGRATDQWKEIMSFIDKQLHELLSNFIMVNLSLRTFAQLSEGGIYEIGPEFVPLADFLATRPDLTDVLERS